MRALFGAVFFIAVGAACACLAIALVSMSEGAKLELIDGARALDRAPVERAIDDTVARTKTRAADAAAGAAARLVDEAVARLKRALDEQAEIAKDSAAERARRALGVDEGSSSSLTGTPDELRDQPIDVR
jgi:hypothetical protein